MRCDGSAGRELAPYGEMMADHSTAGDLLFPFAEPPAHESYIEVAPGVRWLRFPLPFALNHINLWLLEDGDGWALVDTGIHSEDSLALWRRHFETTLEGRPITRVIVTHYHPDHVGCAGFLVDHWKADFLTTRAEWLYSTMLRNETAANVSEFWADYYRSAGLDEDMLRAVAGRGENYGKRVGPVPRPFERLIEGDALTIGGRVWRVLIGTGHAPEMICLYSEEDHLFISADQVLPGISPNVSVNAPEPTSDPLTEFLDSCRKLKSLDAETLVLPMHGRAFYRLHTRLDQLVQHHADRLAVTIEACREPRTITELLPVLFKRKLDFQQTQFAVGEAFAHTNHLVERGELLRIRDAGHPIQFQTI
jgi:glyoxylase-like metal-dependent hydrolase (beta-lactamase superfamily II)